jgi:hypothetical protein
VAVKVTVRCFAAARAAAGFDDEIIGIAPHHRRRAGATSVNGT